MRVLATMLLALGATVQDAESIANSPFSLFKFAVSVPCIALGLYSFILLAAHNRLTWKSFIMCAGSIACGIFLMQDFISA